MNDKLHLFISILASGLLALPEASGELAFEGGVAHFYGSKSRPGIEIRIDDDDAPEEGQRRDVWFGLTVFKDNGVEARAISNLPDGPCDARETETGWEITGISRMHGREISFRAIVSRDRSTLKVLEPKAVVLDDGTKLPLAGRYADLTEKLRAKGARLAFQVIDKELNVVYRKVIAVLDSAEIEELRAEQRRWLHYRDFTFTDEIGWGLVGSADHFRQQGIRTLERITFLRSFLSESPKLGTGHALYSNGRGGTYAVGRLGENIVFSGSILFAHLYSSSICTGSLELNGVARPAEKNAWLAKSGDFFVKDFNFSIDKWSVIPLRFGLDPSGRLHVETVGEATSPGSFGKVVGGIYRRLRALVPAEEPMRSLLVQLPQTAFGDAAQGLQAEGKRALATGSDHGAYKIEKETLNRLVLRGPDGKLQILRMAGADGSAVVAVEQSNHSPSSIRLCKKARAGEEFRPLNNALPRLPVERFYDKGLGDKAAKIREASTYVYKFDHGEGIKLSLKVGQGVTLPDYYYSLDWDGYGFHFSRQRINSKDP